MTTKYRSVPWKRNIMKVPKPILNKLEDISSELVIVAVTKEISFDDVDNSMYAHLGIKHDTGGIIAPESEIPLRGMGKFSARNIDGWEVKRKDLPMITKTYSWESPNFGDACTYGTHTCYQDREVYQCEYYEPKNLKISMDVLKAPDNGSSTALIKFSVDCPLDRTRNDFEDNLLFYLNILQENVGATNIYSSEATRQEFLNTITLGWEIFPPGTSDNILGAFSKWSGVTPHKIGILKERIKLFNALKPKAYIKGQGGFEAYIGAKFSDDLVVFENLNYGNALYVLYDDWDSVSKRSRVDLLKGTTKDFDRFIHRDGWEDNFRHHIKKELRKRRN